MKVEFTDNSDEVLREFKAACLRALERCGMKAGSKNRVLA